MLITRLQPRLRWSRDQGSNEKFYLEKKVKALLVYAHAKKVNMPRAVERQTLHATNKISQDSRPAR